MSQRLANLMNASQPHQCCLCSSAECEVISNKDRHGQPLQTAICKGCGLVHHYPLPTPEEVDTYYNQEYRLSYKKTYTPKLKHTYRAGLVASQRIKDMNAIFTESNNILDIGSGGGELCFMMARIGNKNIRGIEPNEGYARYSKDNLQLNVYEGSYKTVGFKENSFDLITMYHVLEHILNPIELLEQIHKWLCEEGHLVIEVPNIEAVCVSPKNRFHFAHIFNYNLATLEAMGIKTGFAVRHRYTSPDTGIIRVVFQKTTFPKKSLPDLRYNYTQVREFLKRRTLLKHLFSRYPYIRPLKKIGARFNELFTILKNKDGKMLLEKIANSVI